jgi:hypothetical protein
MYLKDGSKEGAKEFSKDGGNVNIDEERLNLGVMDITDQLNSGAMDIIR